MNSFTVTFLVPNVGTVASRMKALSATVSTFSVDELRDAPGKPMNVVASIACRDVTLRGRDASSPRGKGKYEHDPIPVVQVSDEDEDDAFLTTALFPDASWINTRCPGIYSPLDAVNPSSTEGGVKSLQVTLSACVGVVRGPVIFPGGIGADSSNRWVGLLPFFPGEASFNRVAVSASIVQPVLATAWHAVDTKSSGDWLTQWSTQVSMYVASRDAIHSGTAAALKLGPMPAVTVSRGALSKQLRSGEYKPIGESWFQFVLSASHVACMFAPSPSLLLKYRLGSLSGSASLREHPFVVDKFVAQVKDHGLTLMKVSTIADPVTMRAPRTSMGERVPASTRPVELSAKTPAAAHSQAQTRFKLKAIPSLFHAEAVAVPLFEQALATLCASTVRRKMVGTLYRKRRAEVIGARHTRTSSGAGGSGTVASETPVQAPVESDFVLKPLAPDVQTALDRAEFVFRWNVKVSVGVMSNTITPQVWGEIFYMYQVRRCVLRAGVSVCVSCAVMVWRAEAVQ